MCVYYNTCMYVCTSGRVRSYKINSVVHRQQNRSWYLIIAMIPILVATFVLLLILVLLTITMTINYTILIKTEEKDLNFYIKGQLFIDYERRRIGTNPTHILLHIAIASSFSGQRELNRIITDTQNKRVVLKGAQS